MAWNDKLKVPLMASGAAEGEHSLTFLYDYSNFHPFSVDCRQVVEQERTPPTSSINNNNQDRKRRMSWGQLESLERSFQEEIKLEPERKIKLAQELGLHPRKVAVWFQNRRARWKAKQLECLYESLKQEFSVVSREKLKLQEEVAKLKAKLDNKAIEIGASSKGLTAGNAEAEETMDSESAAISSSSTMLTGVNNNQIGNCQGVFNLVGDYNSSSLPYLGVLPGYPYTY